MRTAPLMTAAAVVALLYVVVLEREALIAFATGGDVSEPDTTGEPETAEPEARRVPVVARDFETRPVEQTILMRGRTEAARRVDVRAETSGKVASEPLRKGAGVAAGDLLCEIAPGTRAATLREAEARLDEAELSLRQASELSEGGFAAESRVAGARAAAQAAETAVAAARQELDRLHITAPFDGILETDTAELGALLQPGELCARVIRLDPMRIAGFVPEAQIESVAEGAPAGARLPSGREVRGEVTFVARAADPETRTFRVEVTVDNRDGTLRDGQSADTLIVAEGTQGHLVPGSALTLDDDGRIGVRLVDAAEQARFAPVEVLRDAADGIWVRGLPDTARVIVVGHEFVSEGTALDVTHRPGDADETPDTDDADDAADTMFDFDAADALDDAPAPPPEAAQ